MGLFDPIPVGNAALIAKLFELVKSPRVQYAGRKLQDAAHMAGQPFKSGTPQIGSMPRRPSADNTGGGAQGSILGASLGASLGSLFQNGQDPTATDPLTALYEQLVGQLQSPVAQPQAVDTEDLMRQVQAALNPIYDQRINQAQGTYDRGSEDITNMYRALSNDYERLAPEAAAQAKGAQEDVGQLYGQLRSNIEGSYSRVSQEQADLFKQLGIEAALPDVLGEQQAAVTDATTAASELQATNEQRYMDQGNIDQTYYREGSPLATLTGNDINEDLLFELQNYVNQTNSERAAGIQSAYMDQLGQANSLLAQQQGNAQNETARRQEMLWQMLQSQLSNNQQSQKMSPTDTYLSQLPPQMQQSVAGAFTRLQRSPEAIYGKVEDKRSPVPGTFVETTPEWYLAQADEMLRRGEIDQTTYQALQMYMQLYFQMGQ